MQTQIFLSHNFNDKPLVEPIAIRLAEIYGQGNIFYDSWSINPGDGIIDKMNEGLISPAFVFFFVSMASLNSGMVRLEWQNALYAATKGKTKLIPVRVDGSEMPPILRQTLYIDMHTNGLEASIAQMVSVIQGNVTFTPQHLGFSNLTYTKTSRTNAEIDIVISASHLFEPNANFGIVTMNQNEDLTVESPNHAGTYQNYYANVIPLKLGARANMLAVKPMDAALRPNFPIKLSIKSKSGKLISFLDLKHQISENEWKSIPIAKL